MHFPGRRRCYGEVSGVILSLAGVNLQIALNCSDLQFKMGRGLITQICCWSNPPPFQQQTIMVNTLYFSSSIQSEACHYYDKMPFMMPDVQ